MSECFFVDAPEAYWCISLTVEPKCFSIPDADAAISHNSYWVHKRLYMPPYSLRSVNWTSMVPNNTWHNHWSLFVSPCTLPCLPVCLSALKILTTHITVVFVSDNTAAFFFCKNSMGIQLWGSTFTNITQRTGALLLVTSYFICPRNVFQWHFKTFKYIPFIWWNGVCSWQTLNLLKRILNLETAQAPPLLLTSFFSC